MELSSLIFLLYFRKQLSELKKCKKPTFKRFLIFQVMELSSPKLKKLLCFLVEPLRVFHHCFFSCFNFSPIFTIVFWVFSFHQLSLPWLILCQVLRFCIDVLQVLLIWENFFYSQVFFAIHYFSTFATVTPVLRISNGFFYSQAFFTLHFFPIFGTTCSYQGIPRS